MIYGYIYKLFCLDTREMYIGSTINLKQRINNHKSAIQNTSVSRQIINRNNYIYLILQEGFYVNKEHLRAIEDNYIFRLPCINRNRCFFIYEDWLEKNLENLNEYRKQYKLENLKKMRLRYLKYHEDNKEKRIKYQKEKISCEFCGKLGNRNHRLRHFRICKKNPNNLISQVSI